jgi:hypothetical protein
LLLRDCAQPAEWFREGIGIWDASEREGATDEVLPSAVNGCVRKVWRISRSGDQATTTYRFHRGRAECVAVFAVVPNGSIKSGYDVTDDMLSLTAAYKTISL